MAACAVQQALGALGWQGTNPVGVVLVPGVQLLVTEGLVPVPVSEETQPGNQQKGVA